MLADTRLHEKVDLAANSTTLVSSKVTVMAAAATAVHSAPELALPVTASKAEKRHATLGPE